MFIELNSLFISATVPISCAVIVRLSGVAPRIGGF